MRKIKGYLLAFFVIITGLVICYEYQNTKQIDSQIQNKMGKFELAEYSREIRLFPSQEVLGKIES